MTLPAGWTPERVRGSAASWVWVPPGAEEVRTAEYHLVAYPGHYNEPTAASRFAGERPAEELVEEVLAHTRALGRPDVVLWVTDDTRPAGLRAALERRGAEHVESVDVLVRDLTAPLPPAGGFPGEVRTVDDEASLRASYVVDAEVWGQQRPAGERIADRVADLTRKGATELRAVALLDGEPVSTGGGTLAEDGAMLRLWGAGTRPAYRGRGGYQAVLAHRLHVARDRGAVLALVKAVTTTSSPILHRLGFAGVGQEHGFRLPA